MYIYIYIYIIYIYMYIYIHTDIYLYSPWKTTMTSGQDVSEFFDILGLVKSYFSSFFGGVYQLNVIN